MDHAWAARELGEFRDYIDGLQHIESLTGEDYDELYPASARMAISLTN